MASNTPSSSWGQLSWLCRLPVLVKINSKPRADDSHYGQQTCFSRTERGSHKATADLRATPSSSHDTPQRRPVLSTPRYPLHTAGLPRVQPQPGPGQYGHRSQEQATRRPGRAPPGRHTHTHPLPQAPQRGRAARPLPRARSGVTPGGVGHGTTLLQPRPVAAARYSRVGVQVLEGELGPVQAAVIGQGHGGGDRARAELRVCRRPCAPRGLPAHHPPPPAGSRRGFPAGPQPPAAPAAHPPAPLCSRPRLRSHPAAAAAATPVRGGGTELLTTHWAGRGT